MDIEQIRKDFEEYAKSNLLITESYGFLSEPSARRLFKAGWQAAHKHYAKPAAPVDMPEPVMAQVRYIASQSTKWSNCTVENVDAMVGGAYEVRYLYTEQQVRALLANTKRSTNRDDESVGLREALVRAHDWMDSQADSQSKGGHATFDLMMLREERNAIKSALDESPQPQADALDAERYRWLRDEWLGNEPEAINMERAKGQRGLDAAIDAAIAAAKEMK